VKDHNKQKFWQILFPLILFILIVLVVTIILIIQTSTAYPSGFKFANISIIYLILLSVLPGLIILLIIGALIYGLTKILKYTPLYSKVAQTYVFIAATKIIMVADYLVKPFFFIKSFFAGSRKGISTLKNSFSSKQ
jgi:hypothetical protein